MYMYAIPHSPVRVPKKRKQNESNSATDAIVEPLASCERRVILAALVNEVLGIVSLWRTHIHSEEFVVNVVCDVKPTSLTGCSAVPRCRYCKIATA